MPEFYRNAWYAQLKKKVDELQEEIEKAIELPSVTSADEGKVLTVGNDGKWAAEEVPKELPSVTSADEGKVLTVDNDGKWDTEDVPKELPSVTSADEGKVLTVDSSGEWSAEILNCGNHFSTDEQVIGTWINGSKIYQKTFHIIENFSTHMTITHNISNLGTMIQIFGTRNTRAYIPNIPVENDVIEPQWSAVVSDITDTTFVINIGSNALVNTNEINITLRYTKTT